VSQPDSSSDSPRGVLVPKPKTSIYTIMLIIALAAIVIGCTVMWLEVLQYGWPWEFPWRIPANLR
jgi:hypothetical protein